MEYINGDNFSFNNKNSDTDFYLIMVSFDDSSGFIEPDTAQSLELTKETVGNNPKSRLINVKYEDVLTFNIGLAKSMGDEFTTAETRNIHKWLMGDKYSSITIDNARYENIHFNAIVTNIQEEKIGDKIIGFTITFECDSPYGYETITNTYDIASTKTISINNTSDDFINSKHYVKPTISVIGGSTGSITIKNNTLNEETTLSILSSENITMDGENMVITSSVANQNLYSKFNRVWFKLEMGVNSITITGKATVTITFNVARKVGI